MALEFAILGFLDKSSFSGYDLKKKFDQSFHHIWNADQSHIYRALAKLNKNGLVTQEIIEQNERPDRKVYHITQEGRDALNEWLLSPLPFPSVRYQTMLQMFFSTQLNDDELLDKVKRNAFILHEAIAELEKASTTKNFFGELVTSERDDYISSVTLEIRKRDLETRLEVSEEIIRRLENGEFPKEKKNFSVD